MALKLILQGNANYLRGLLHRSVFKSLAGVLRVKFLALLVVLFIYIWTQINMYVLRVCTHTRAPWPLLDPSVAQPGCRFQWKSCLERS